MSIDTQVLTDALSLSSAILDQIDRYANEIDHDLDGRSVMIGLGTAIVSATEKIASKLDREKFVNDYLQWLKVAMLEGTHAV